jgi:hypothetical protein
MSAMAGSPCFRRAPFGLLLLIGTVCLFLPIFSCLLHPQYARLDAMHQILQQQEAMQQTLNNMSIQQEFNSPEGTALRAQMVSLQSRYNAVAAAQMRTTGWILICEYVFLAVSLAYLIRVYRKKRISLSS